MTQEVETDLQLNRLILSGTKDRLAAEIEKYNAFMDKFHDQVEQKVLDALAVVFRADPEIQSFQWSQTSGEYNDNTYDGFTIGYPSVIFNSSVSLTDWQGENYNTDDGEPIEVESLPKGDVRDLLEVLHHYILSTSRCWEEKYGSHVQISIERDKGFSTSPHDS